MKGAKPHILVQEAMLLLLALALKYPTVMGKVLSDLHDALIADNEEDAFDGDDEGNIDGDKESDADSIKEDTLFFDAIKKCLKTMGENITKANGEFSTRIFDRKAKVIRKMNSNKFNELKMADIGKENMRLVRTFSFVGSDMDNAYLDATPQHIQN